MEDAARREPMALEQDRRIAEVVKREESRLRSFIRWRVRDPRDAEDILQDVFYALVEANRLLMPIEHLTGWLFRVAHNYVLDQMKAASRNEVGVESLLNVPCPEHLSHTGGGVSELLQELMQIGLSPREMECVRLRAEDLRYEEIAVVLGLHAGTVGART